MFKLEQKRLDYKLGGRRQYYFRYYPIKKYTLFHNVIFLNHLSLLYPMKLQAKFNSTATSKLGKKETLTETDIQSSCCKSTNKSTSNSHLKNNKNKLIKKKLSHQPKKIIFHQRICRLRIQGTNKTARICLYKESDMCWSKKFTEKLCPQLIDNDIESQSEMIESEVERCRKSLMEAVENEIRIRKHP